MTDTTTSDPVPAGGAPDESAVVREPPPSPRVDLATAAVLFVLAVAIVAQALRMPTFTERGADLFQAPGIVPGFYGTVLALLSLVLAARSLYRGVRKAGVGAGRTTGSSYLRLVLAALLGSLFAVGLVGSLPFWAATAIFVTLFIALFEWRPEPRRRRVIRLATALLQGVLTGAAVHLVFQELFLVRLP